MTERATAFYCPYCGDEGLRPFDAEPGRFTCTACRRAFHLRLLATGAQEPTG